jgi:hypothetical protein
MSAVLYREWQHVVPQSPAATGLERSISGNDCLSSLQAMRYRDLLLTRRFAHTSACHSLRCRSTEANRAIQSISIDELARDWLSHPLRAGPGKSGGRRESRTGGSASILTAITISLTVRPPRLWVESCNSTLLYPKRRRSGWCPSASAKAPTRFKYSSADCGEEEPARVKTRGRCSTTRRRY